MSPVDMMLVGLLFGLISLADRATGAGPREVFTNQFYVELQKDLPLNDVHTLAKRHGFVNLGPVSPAAVHPPTCLSPPAS